MKIATPGQSSLQKPGTDSYPATVPRLSVVIPTYNSAATLRSCLDSVDTQSFEDYEILIQDGGSTDGTADVVRAFHKAHPSRDVRWFSEPDRGVYDAMNKGIRHASGSWLYFLGSDDELFHESTFETLLGSAGREQAGVLYGDVEMIGHGPTQEGVLYGGQFTLTKLLRQNICHQAILYRKDVIEKVGLYNLSYKTWADWDLNLRCWAVTRFQYVNVTVANFRLGGLSSQDGGVDRLFIQDVAENAMRYLKLSPLNPAVNARDFIGWEVLEALQYRKSPGYHALARLIRLPRETYKLLGRVSKRFR